MKLQQGVALYVEDKRSCGMQFTKGHQNLISFARFVGDMSLERIQSRHIVTFLNGPRTSNTTWVQKYNLLRNFFRFWVERNCMRMPPLPTARRKSPQTFMPYIYSRAEIRVLLSSTRASQESSTSRIDGRTLRTLLLFLYGTGALIGEGRRLLCEDVDFERKVVTIRNSLCQPSRTIPFGSDLEKILTSYFRSHHQKSARKAQHFFVCKDGSSISDSYLNNTFQKLRRHARIVRHDGIAQPPRMHDLRYTFAVHRLTAWHKHGADLHRMIPALSVYMGYVRLGATARFLRFIPERFRGPLNKLSPRQAKRHWRDDPKLMQFLSTL